MEERAATRWLVALGAASAAAAVPLDRLTPGGTFGLEFTTLLAALAVALFVLIAYALIVGGDPGPTPGDAPRPTSSTDLRTAWLTTSPRW